MKNELAETTGDAVAARVIERTRHEVEASAQAMRKGCGHALKAGLGLIWLHQALGVESVYDFTGSKAEAADAIKAWKQRAF